MKKHNYFNQIIKALVILLGIAALCYGAYHLYYFAIDAYHAAVAHAAQEIRVSVSGGIQEGVDKSLDPVAQKIRAGVSGGVQEGVGRSLNPVRAVKGVFGFGRSSRSGQQ
jgi:hypothetical protein